MMRRYYALAKDAVSGTGEIRRDQTERFYEIVARESGLTRPEIEATLNAGKRIETTRFLIWSEPINPFTPVKIPLP